MSERVRFNLLAESELEVSLTTDYLGPITSQTPCRSIHNPTT